MIERILVAIMLVVGAILIIVGYRVVGIPLILLGLLTTILVFRMENKRYKTPDRYIIIDAKLKDDRE